jgi:phosphatidylserine decarboxylase
MDEALIMDRVMAFLYSESRESPSTLQRAIASSWCTDLLATWEFDLPLVGGRSAMQRRLHRLGINTQETLVDLTHARTLRAVFERKIRYWDVRPSPYPIEQIVSPADGKLLPFGGKDAMLPVKSKFISIDDLVATRRARASCANGVAGVIVRLTPELYHFVHTPVAGIVLEHSLVEGAFHSCNPSALVSFQAPYTLNRRTVTLIDTDVPAGSQVGVVIVVCVAAMMIGDIQMCYSETAYNAPTQVRKGLYVRRGVPLALFRPGSSTCIVMWNPKRAQLSASLLSNAGNRAVKSRFSDWLGAAWVETAVQARESIALSSKEVTYA